MSPQNQAAWLKVKQDTSMPVDQAPYPSFGPDELVIQTRAIAMNPADHMLQRTGMLLSKYPAILGCDAAGIVQEVGANLATDFRVGDKVFGAAGPLRDYKYSAFQEYVVLKAPSIAKMPDSTDFKDAAVIPLGFNTAASCLFGADMLDVEIPPDMTSTQKTLLIWGASGSVGSNAVQLAAAAGYEIFAIAGSANHNMLKSIGAAQCFDYRDDKLVGKVVQQLEAPKRNVIGALDAISSEKTLHALCEILDQVGGRKFIASIMPGAEQQTKLGVEIKSNFANDIQKNGIAKRLWEDFLPASLADGRYKCKPDAEVVGHGLEKVQEAVDLLADGVSAKKLVVTL